MEAPCCRTLELKDVRRPWRRSEGIRVVPGARRHSGSTRRRSGCIREALVGLGRFRAFWRRQALGYAPPRRHAHAVSSGKCSSSPLIFLSQRILQAVSELRLPGASAAWWPLPRCLQLRVRPSRTQRTNRQRCSGVSRRRLSGSLVSRGWAAVLSAAPGPGRER